MAQRIYLIPVNPQITQAVLTLMTCSQAQEPVLWGKLMNYGKRQYALNTLSVRCASGFRDEAFPQDEISKLNLYRSLRPYFIVDESPGGALEAVVRLRQANSAAEIQSELQRQMEPIKSRWSEPPKEENPATQEEQWSQVRELLTKVKAIRSAIGARKPFTLQVPKEEVVNVEGVNMRFQSVTETEPKDIPAGELPVLYGHSLGALWGKINGLCEPSWWLGRNFWIGLLLNAPLPLTAKMKFSKFRKEIGALGQSPAALFQSIGVPGFEKGMATDIPTYSSGMYFPPENLGALLKSLQEHRAEWVQLGCLVTGYEASDCEGLVQMAEEAALWAHRQGFGLVEGDDLVGSMGCR